MPTEMEDILDAVATKPNQKKATPTPPKPTQTDKPIRVGLAQPLLLPNRPDKTTILMDATPVPGARIPHGTLIASLSLHPAGILVRQGSTRYVIPAAQIAFIELE